MLGILLVPAQGTARFGHRPRPPHAGTGGRGRRDWGLVQGKELGKGKAGL